MRIEDGTFSGCINLTEIVLTSSITYIGNAPFSGCAALTSLAIPEGITSLGNNTFFGCTSLTSITIPNNVTSIGDNAFYGCESIAKITIPGNVTTMGMNVFQNCSNLTIYAGKSSKPSGWDISWNSSNCPVYWKVTSSYIVMSSFGFDKNFYLWYGDVTLNANDSSFCYKYNNIIVFTGDTHSFTIETFVMINLWYKIIGTVDFVLRDSSNTIIQTHNASVNVSATGVVTITNGTFSINTADLSNGRYTLTLTSNFIRRSLTDSDTKTFTFVVDK